MDSHLNPLTTSTFTLVYNGYYIDIVSEFNYLGVLMNSNGKFFKTQKHVADQGRKALFSILNK